VHADNPPRVDVEADAQRFFGRHVDEARHRRHVVLGTPP
jgi:hypothetical protein